MHDHPRHPLSLAFGKKKDPLLETFGTPTQPVAVESTRVKNGTHLEYSPQDIDTVIGKLGVAIGVSVAGLSGEKRLKKVETILDTWNRHLAREGRTPLFIPREKATEAYRAQVRLNALAGDLDHDETTVANEAERLARVAVATQKESLAQWILYLTEKNENGFIYSPRFQALVFKAITDRASSTINPIPPVHSAALGELEQMMHEHIADHPRSPNEEDIQTRALTSFPELYKAAMARIDAEQKLLREGSEVTDGTWETLGSADIARITTLCTNTPLCLRFENWARSYTAGGQKLRLYLTKDAGGSYALPRIAICFKQNGQKSSIIEMRGTDGANQHLEAIPALAEIAQKEASRYENGAGYVKKANDALMLARLEKKTRLLAQNRTKVEYQLTEEELRRLYELDERFTDFGRGAQLSKAAEIRKGRDTAKDVESLFGTVATSVDDLRGKRQSGVSVKAYLGPISADLWPHLQGIEHVFTSFPEGRITRRVLSLKPTSKEGLLSILKKKSVSVIGYAQDMIGKISEEDLERDETFETVTLEVRDLFTPDELRAFGNRLPTTNDVFDSRRLARLGIDRCPSTAAAAIITDHDATLQSGRWEYLAMEPISDRDGNPFVFLAARHDDGSLSLGNAWASPDVAWGLENRLVFRLRKSH